MQNICRSYATNMLKLCNKYAEHMQIICCNYANTMQNIYRNYATIKYAQHMHKLCKQICRNNAINILKICINYAKENRPRFLHPSGRLANRLACGAMYRWRQDCKYHFKTQYELSAELDGEFDGDKGKGKPP